MPDFVIKIDGEGKVEQMAGEPDVRSSAAGRMDEIRRLINDKDSSLSEIKRMIAVEISIVNAQQLDSANPPNLLDAVKIKSLSEVVKSLRELSKEVTETDLLTRRDYLNLDGPKFAFVAGEWVEGFKKAMKEVGMEESTTVSVLKTFRDLMSSDETRIRREVDKIG